MAVRQKRKSKTQAMMDLLKNEKHFVDFSPFLASFGKYKKGMNSREQCVFMNEQLQKIRYNGVMVRMISLVFNYELDKVNLEQNMFKVEERVTLLFNFINLTFQLFTKPLDEKYTRLTGYFNKV